jgi:hypothetical protein
VSFATINLCCFSMSNTKGKRIFRYDTVRKLLDNTRTSHFIFNLSFEVYIQYLVKKPEKHEDLGRGGRLILE